MARLPGAPSTFVNTQVDEREALLGGARANTGFNAAPTARRSAVWWRCHRRIVTDHVLARGVPVIHLFSREKGEPASLTPFARVGAHFHVSYPAL